MKKLFVYFLCIASICGLCACESTYKEIKADDDTFLVELRLDCEDEVSAVQFEYYLNGASVGGGAVSNADGSAISQKDTLPMEFVADDFPACADMSDFQLELFVIDGDGNQHPCSGMLEFEAEYGSTYGALVSGGSKSEFFARLTTDAQA